MGIFFFIFVYHRQRWASFLHFCTSQVEMNIFFFIFVYHRQRWASFSSFLYITARDGHIFLNFCTSQVEMGIFFLILVYQSRDGHLFIFIYQRQGWTSVFPFCTSQVEMGIFLVISDLPFSERQAQFPMVTIKFLSDREQICAIHFTKKPLLKITFFKRI